MDKLKRVKTELAFAQIRFNLEPTRESRIRYLELALYAHILEGTDSSPKVNYEERRLQLEAELYRLKMLA